MVRVSVALVAALLFCACGGDDDGDENVLPIELEPGWNEIATGGDTICSRGDDYAFWVRQGSVNKVVVDFIGGGACWDAFTCSVADAIFEDTVDSVREDIEGGQQSGFYDVDNPDNPFADWYHVVIPYCTGDIHWGDSVTTYNEGDSNEITINHKGAVNTRAVLDWMVENFGGPDQIFVTGCSAGSYGSALWAAHVMEQYPDSDIIQFGDSGSGIITEEFFQDSFPSWNAVDAFPTFIPALDPDEVDIMSMALPDLYAGIANHFSEQWLSQYNTVFDENQHFYYQVMGGGPVEEWSQLMQASIEEIESRADNFSSFIAPGEQHCILPFDNFFTVEANGVPLTDWLSELLDQGSVDSVACQDTECDGETP
jgi:hypothetical protein